MNVLILQIRAINLAGCSLEKIGKISLLLPFFLEVMDESEEFVEISIVMIIEAQLQCLLFLLLLHLSNVTQNVVRLALFLSIKDYCMHPKKWMFMMIDSMWIYGWSYNVGYFGLLLRKVSGEIHLLPTKGLLRINSWESEFWGNSISPYKIYHAVYKLNLIILYGL